jgi:hypothetical protein
MHYFVLIVQIMHNLYKKKVGQEVYSLSKVKYVLLAVTSVAFVVMAALFWREQKENIRYEAYLSDILSGKVSQMVSNISSLERTLAEVIDTQEITKNQASSLCSNFSSIKDRNREIVEIGVRLDKMPRDNSDRTIMTNAKMSEYFKKLSDALNPDEIDQLAPTQLEGFHEFLELIRSYKEIAKSDIHGITDTGVNGEYWNRYFVDGVEKDYWVDLIDGMEEISPDYTNFTLLNHSTDKMSVE